MYPRADFFQQSFSVDDEGGNPLMGGLLVVRLRHPSFITMMTRAIYEGGSCKELDGMVEVLMPQHRQAEDYWREFEQWRLEKAAQKQQEKDR